MLTPEQIEAFAKAEEEATCEHCGRCVLAGPPCCYQKVYDLWVAADKEVHWLRKIQSKQAKRIHALQTDLLRCQDQSNGK